jgi:hypothetical protein
MFSLFSVFFILCSKNFSPAGARSLKFLRMALGAERNSQQQDEIQDNYLHTAFIEETNQRGR